MAKEAQAAVDRLAGMGLSVALCDMRVIKPIPDALFEEIHATGVSRVVCVEDGIIAGGASSALMEGFAARGIAVLVTAIGIDDTFSVHGTQAELKRKEGLTVEAIVDAIRGTHA